MTKVDSGVVLYGSGESTTTFSLTIAENPVFQPGDVIVLDVLAATRDRTLSSLPGGIVTLLPMGSPGGTTAVSAGTYLYTIPETEPASLTWVWGAATEGNIVWSAWRGVDAATRAFSTTSGTPDGWLDAGAASVNAPSVTTTAAGAQIVSGLQIASGSETVTLSPGTPTVLASGSRRKGYQVDRGVQSTPGSSGILTYTFGAGTYRARAWQLALHPSASSSTPGAIAGVTTSSLTDPVGRWTKPTTRVSWHDGTNWAAVLPTTSGHRLFTDLDAPTAGAVVDSRQGARPTIVAQGGWLGVLRGHPTQSRFSSYNAASSYAPLVTDAVVPLTPGNTDQSPIAMCRSANGYLWAAMVSGGNVTVTRSTDNGATWGAAQNVITGWTLFPTGVVSLVATGTTVVLLATGNDGSGRAARSIPQASSSYAAGSWTTETLPALPGGIASDDHLSTTVAPDGRVFAAAKTTNGNTATLLIYALERSTGGTWTSYTVETGPDDDGFGIAGPGYSRPGITIAYDQVVVAYGSIYSPRNVSYRTAPLSDLSAWSARSVLVTGPDYQDSAQLPDAAHVRSAAGQFPVLAHKVDTGDIILTWMDSGVPPAPTVTYAIVGAPTSDGFTVSTRVSAGQSVRVRTAGADGTAGTPDSAGWSKSTLTGLAAATVAAYDVEITEIDGHVSTVTEVGQGKTLPAAGSQAGFTFGFGSCFDTLSGSLTTPNTGAFARLRARNPDLFFHLGDFTYADNAGTSQASHRADLEQALGYSPALQDLVRDTATVYVKSDHDAGGGNNSAPGVWTAGNRAAALQVFPYATRPDSNGLYHSFVVGRVRFIVTDTRYLVTSTSRLGTTQKAWFKTQLQQPEPVKVWVQEATWIDNKPAESGGDKWQDFAADKAELGTFIATQAVGQVITIHGDQHSLAADDGTHNAWGGFPSFCAAPFRNFTSIKTLSTGDWSDGFYPNPPGAEAAQHGFCTVTDTGDTITLALRGYDTSNTLRVSMDVVVPTVAPEPGTGPKVVVGGVETAATWTVIQGGIEVPVEWTAVAAGVEVPLV